MFAIRKRSEIFQTVHYAGCSNVRENFWEAQPCTERSRMAEKKDDKEKNGWAVMDGDGVIEDFWRHIFFSLPIDVFHRYGSSRVIYRETHGFSQNSWWVVSTSSPRSKKSLTFSGWNGGISVKYHVTTWLCSHSYLLILLLVGGWYMMVLEVKC